MLRTILFVLLACWLAASVVAQEACGEPTGNVASPIAFVDTSDFEHNAEQLNGQIINYLNTTGSADGLPAAVTALNEGGFPAFAAEVVEADITADNVPDSLVLITVSYGAGFSEYLSLFTCGDNGFSLLDSHLANRWGGDDLDEPPASVVLVQDMNDNQRPEIILRITTIEGMKYHESLNMLEWDGTALATTFQPGRITVRTATWV
jgi:hypothetical protein